MSQKIREMITRRPVTVSASASAPGRVSAAAPNH